MQRDLKGILKRPYKEIKDRSAKMYARYNELFKSIGRLAGVKDPETKKKEK